jgi:hypothetical protein
LPEEVAELAWVQDIIRPADPKVCGKMGGLKNPKKKRYGKPVASQKAKVLRGWKAQVIGAKAKPPKFDISLPMPPAGVMIEGADKWGKVSHASE